MSKVRLIGSLVLNESEDRIVTMSQELMDVLGVNAGSKVVLGGDGLYTVNIAGDVDVKLFGKDCAFVSHKNIDNVESVTDVDKVCHGILSIGSDPEFILVDDKGVVKNADFVFPKVAMLGSDAGLGELRPLPSRSPRMVVENLRRLIRQIPTRTDLIPIATSYYNGWLTGFHIHFELPQALLTYAADYSIEFVRNCITVLDYYIGIPAMLADDSDKRRLSSAEYGRPGDFRIGDKTIEYRTPGGFHLRHPAYANRLFNAAYVVMEEIIGRAVILTNNWTEMNRFYSSEHFMNEFRIPSKKYIHHLLSTPSRNDAIKEMEKVCRNYEGIIGGRNNYTDEFLNLKPEKASLILTDNW